MSTIITRLYKTDQAAMDAVAALKKAGMRAADCSTVSALGGGAGPDAPPADVSSIVAAIAKGGVPLSHAKVYANLVCNGAALVTVRAPPLTTLHTIKILKRFGPIETGVARPDVFIEAEAIGLPRILRGKPNTVLMDSDRYFSSLFGLPLIVRGKESTSGLLTNSKPFSGLLQGTTSSWLGLPTIVHDRRS